MERKELGQILLEKGLITVEQLEEALTEQAKTKKFLGEILIEKNFVTKEKILEALTEQKKANFVKLSSLKGIKEEVVKLIPENIARRFVCIPIAKENGTLTVAMKDPTDIVAIDTIRRITGVRVKVVKADENEIIENIERFYRKVDNLEDLTSFMEEREEEEEVDIEQLRVAAEDVPVVRFVNSLFIEAVEKRATDIHLEPTARDVMVRFRIDGILHKFTTTPKNVYPGIVTRIKILSNLDIGERRLPQDGRIKTKIGVKEVDIRVSTLPTIFGEKIVMRILQKEAFIKTLDNLGFEEKDKEKFEETLKKPYGMIIVTGPTGSGKTTTLYSGLNLINSPEKNIITIEDPVEYVIEGINQVQIKPKIGLTFAEILKRILRQDPDVIMVGEIRDLETAQIAIQASLTGHLVISTLHTNDTVSTISRFRYMGVPQYLLGDSLILVLSQRLVRKICPVCKYEDKDGKEVLKNMGIDVKDKKIFKGKGCRNCDYTGYYGRTGIFELLEITREIRNMILNGSNENEIREVAKKQGMISLKEAALQKVFDGITTVDEFLSKTMV